MSEQEQQINKQLMDLQQSQMGASLQPRFNNQNLNLASRMNPRVRQNLAFGTLDDALSERTGGISAI